MFNNRMLGAENVERTGKATGVDDRAVQKMDGLGEGGRTY
jgi:hypothetical protein